MVRRNKYQLLHLMNLATTIIWTLEQTHEIMIVPVVDMIPLVPSDPALSATIVVR